jgi:hypothetical protein
MGRTPFLFTLTLPKCEQPVDVLFSVPNNHCAQWYQLGQWGAWCPIQLQLLHLFVLAIPAHLEAESMLINPS